MTALYFRFKTAPVGRILRASLSFVSILVIMGCTNPFVDSDSSQEPETGSLTVSTETALTGSTVEPNLGALDTLALRWDVSFAYTGPGTAGSLTRADVNNYSLGTTITGVPYGDWDITIVGYADSGGTQRVAEGTASLTVGAGVNSLAIPISAAMVGNGDIDFTVTFPAAQVDGATVQLDPWPEGGGDVTTLAAGTDYNSDFATSGSLAVTINRPAGEYLLTVQLTDTTVSNGSGNHAPVIELVRVFENLTSSGTVALATSDLRSPPAPPTGLGVTLGDGTFDLDWTDASNTELGFRVYDGAIDATAEGSVGPSATTIASASITGAPGAGTAVTYNVVSYNQFGESAPATITFTPLDLGTLFPAGTPGSPTTQNASVTLGWGTFFGVGTYNLYISQTQTDVDNLDPGVRTPNAIAGNAASSYISLTDGTTYYWTVEAVNPEGNGTLAAPTAAFAVDATPPTAPTIVAGTTGDGYQSNAEGAAPTIDLTFEAGADLTYALTGPTAVGSTALADAGSDGAESISLPTLAEGSYTFSVTATDTFGNVSTVATRTFVVDLTPPVTITGITSADVRGTSPDEYTISQTPTFTFGSGEEAGATVEYSTDGGTTWATAGTAVLGSFQLPTLGFANDYGISFRQVDPAGNIGTATTGITLDVLNSGSGTITVTNPGVPTFTPTGLPLLVDVGGGGNPQSATVSVNDTLPTGQTITNYVWEINGTEVANAAGASSYIFDAGTGALPPAPMIMGVNSVTIIVEVDPDGAGPLTSIPYSEIFTFTVVDE